MAFLLFLTVIQVVLQTQLVYNVNAENGVLRFMVLGDWGGLPFPMFNYSTAIERGVADGMARLANKKPQDFVIALGDNFYFTGVENVEDERFFLTYENVFHDQSLQIPWYVCAGNHDHYGNVSAQIAYTKKSNRWNFPSLFYSKTFAVQGTSTTVQLILIDTVLLCGNTASDESETPLPGPKFPEMADRQLEWIVHEIRSSTADYILVGGHYPIYSAGMHGNTQILIDNLTPIFKKYDVTAFLAGHDHNNQHIIVNNLNYLVTGCATFAQHWPLKQDELPKGSLHFFWADGKEFGGFIAFEANESSMNATFMSGTGLELHQVTMVPRKIRKDSSNKFQEI